MNLYMKTCKIKIKNKKKNIFIKILDKIFRKFNFI